MKGLFSEFYGNCFSKLQLVGQNIETKQLKIAKLESAAIVLVFKAGAFLD